MPPFPSVVHRWIPVPSQRGKLLVNAFCAQPCVVKNPKSRNPPGVFILFRRPSHRLLRNFGHFRFAFAPSSFLEDKLDPWFGSLVYCFLFPDSEYVSSKIIRWRMSDYLLYGSLHPGSPLTPDPLWFEVWPYLCFIEWETWFGSSILPCLAVPQTCVALRWSNLVRGGELSRISSVVSCGRVAQYHNTSVNLEDVWSHNSFKTIWQALSISSPTLI
jgi:hypothetical protein